MLHVPNMSMTIIDVERTLERPFFDALQELYPQSIVLPNPGKEEFYNIGFGKNSIVVHSLITEAPIQSLGGIIVPTAEKLFVDIALNPNLIFTWIRNIHGLENILRLLISPSHNYGDMPDGAVANRIYVTLLNVNKFKR